MDYKKLAAAAEQYKSVVAEGAEELADAMNKSYTPRLPVGFHEGCTITKVEVGQEAAKDGSTAMANDQSFQRCFITYEKDGKNFRKFYAVPTVSYLYGTSRATNFAKDVSAVFEACFGVKPNQHNLLALCKIFLENPELVVGSVVDVTIRESEISHIKYVDKGVYKIIKRSPKMEDTEVDVAFPDYKAADAYAKQNGIRLGKADLKKVSPSVKTCVPEGLVPVFEILGLIEGGEAEPTTEKPNTTTQAKSRNKLLI